MVSMPPPPQKKSANANPVKHDRENKHASDALAESTADRAAAALAREMWSAVRSAHNAAVLAENSNPMELERYPCPYQRTLKKRFCDRKRGSGIREENVFVGVGSDEAIDLLMRIFCVPGATNTSGSSYSSDAILITPPTYGMYKVCARVNDVRVTSVPLTKDFDVRVDEMLAAADGRTKLMFVCSPGNPTSKAIPLADIRRLAQSEAYSGILVVDEAYVDFSGPQSSAMGLVTEFNNVVVLQTLSKAYGLAGIRCGFAVGPPDVIRLMNNVKAPYNVNKLTSDVAINALDGTKGSKVLQTNIESVLDQRTKVATRLAQMDFVQKVYPSDANFLLFRVGTHALELYKRMANRGVVSRFRGNEMHCDGCLRVTIGTAEENEAFLGMIPKVYEEINASTQL